MNWALFHTKIALCGKRLLTCLLLLPLLAFFSLFRRKLNKMHSHLALQPQSTTDTNSTSIFLCSSLPVCCVCSKATNSFFVFLFILLLLLLLLCNHGFTSLSIYLSLPFIRNIADVGFVNGKNTTSTLKQPHSSTE